MMDDQTQLSDDGYIEIDMDLWIQKELIWMVFVLELFGKKRIPKSFLPGLPDFCRYPF